MADATPSPVRPSWRRRHWRKITLLLVILIPVLIFSAWSYLTITLHYSAGDRAGYAQKLSDKGWVCKTWEGELAMANLPGSMPEIFKFTVKSDSIAKVITNNLGKRVSLHYEEHRGVPAKCFGDTQYYVTNVRILEP
ncbi:MAG: hypothetical protein ABI556_16550 [Gemmatimonadales bacterium]